MLTKEEIARYDRHLLLPEFGIQAQERLKRSKILVIGAGGLGCPALLYLTAAGVGELGIIDFDKVEESNLQRQVLFTTEDIGRSKAETAAKKLSKHNPFVRINFYDQRLTNENAIELFSNYDLIIDGTDNFATRYLVNDVCIITDRPFVYGSIHKFEGQVSVFNLTDERGNKGPTYRCLFPTPPSKDSAPNCSEIGVLGVLPGIIGTLQATEAIKVITGIGETLSGRLLLFNTLNMSFMTLEIIRNEVSNKKIPLSKEELLRMNYEHFCGTARSKTSVRSITFDELQELMRSGEEIQLLDVRELFEEPQIDELIDLQIPLSEIREQHSKISKNKKVIVFCKSGIRSKQAIELLRGDLGFNNLYNLEGGITKWINNYQIK